MEFDQKNFCQSNQLLIKANWKPIKRKKNGWWNEFGLLYIQSWNDQMDCDSKIFFSVKFRQLKFISVESLGGNFFNFKTLEFFLGEKIWIWIWIHFSINFSCFFISYFLVTKIFSQWNYFPSDKLNWFFTDLHCNYHRGCWTIEI